MKQLSVITVTILTMLLFSTSAMAWSNCKTKRGNADCNQQENRIERMALILDLSAEQQQQMTELRTKHQQQRAQMRTELQEARQQLRDIQPGVALDSKNLKAQARAYADLKAAMLVNKIEHKQQMFSILTPEQQEKATKLRELKAECKCNGCEFQGKGCCGVNAEDCPKGLGKGCNAQGKKGGNNRGFQSPCMQQRCR